MNSLRINKFVDRLSELINEGNEIISLEQPSIKDPSVNTIREGDRILAWLIRSKNIISLAFGLESIQYKELDKLTQSDIFYKSQVNKVKGLLIGCKDDLEKGFLIGYELLLSADLFDSIIEQIKELLIADYKDAAAILLRVVVENSLKKLAKNENIEVESTTKASVINDLLKDKVYNKIQWRTIQKWLDIGNSAAHGKFNEYNKTEIERLLQEVESFLITYFNT